MNTKTSTETEVKVKEDNTAVEEQTKNSKVLEKIEDLKKKKDITLEDLLKAGVHFGHQKSKWNPKMKKFVLTIRDGVRIINLYETLERLEKAATFLKEKKNEGDILIVGTKRQAKHIVKDVAEYLKVPYVIERWLGGTLTNFKTIRKRIEKLLLVEEYQEKGELKKYTKKEQAKFKEKLEKFNERMGGIKTLKELPKAVFVIDLVADELAVKEAQRMGIPVVAIADTNADPRQADIIIPGNDDAVGSISFILSYIASRIKD